MPSWHKKDLDYAKQSFIRHRCQKIVYEQIDFSLLL